MKVCRLQISNFRGVSSATILLPNHAVLIGDNNTGKTTILEALDLALGPDRLNRTPPIDEHDFYQGKYIGGKPINSDSEATAASTNDVLANSEYAEDAADSSDGFADPDNGSIADAPRIEIEVTIADLTEEQKARFGDYTEFWDRATDTFYNDPNPAGVDAAMITEALRVTFLGWYDAEEDDFEGKTYFTRSVTESENPVGFSKRDKQTCGF